MHVSKWGNSLAVRLPKHVVERLGLKEGDEVKVTPQGDWRLVVERKLTREQAVKALWESKRPLPADFKFDRDEANER